MSEETPAQLREALDAANKENKRLQKLVAESTGELRSLKASSAFTDAGLSPELAKLYVAANPEGDITKETAAAFAKQYGISPVEQVEEDVETTETPVTDGLENFARASSRAGTGGTAPASTKYLTRDEFVQLQVSNPVEAQKVLAEGRVRLRNDNPYASGAIPGVNPFAPSTESND